MLISIMLYTVKIAALEIKYPTRAELYSMLKNNQLRSLAIDFVKTEEQNTGKSPYEDREVKRIRKNNNISTPLSELEKEKQDADNFRREALSPSFKMPSDPKPPVKLNGMPGNLHSNHRSGFLDEYAIAEHSQPSEHGDRNLHSKLDTSVKMQQVGKSGVKVSSREKAHGDPEVKVEKIKDESKEKPKAKKNLKSGLEESQDKQETVRDGKEGQPENAKARESPKAVEQKEAMSKKEPAASVEHLKMHYELKEIKAKNSKEKEKGKEPAVKKEKYPEVKEINDRNPKNTNKPAKGKSIDKHYPSIVQANLQDKEVNQHHPVSLRYKARAKEASSEANPRNGMDERSMQSVESNRYMFLSEEKIKEQEAKRYEGKPSKEAPVSVNENSSSRVADEPIEKNLFQFVSEHERRAESKN